MTPESSSGMTMKSSRNDTGNTQENDNSLSLSHLDPTISSQSVITVPRHGNLLCKEIPLSSKGMTMKSSRNDTGNTQENDNSLSLSHLDPTISSQSVITVPRHGNLLCKEIPLSSKGMTMKSSRNDTGNTQENDNSLSLSHLDPTISSQSVITVPRHGNLLCKEIPLSSKGMTMKSSRNDTGNTQENDNSLSLSHLDPTISSQSVITVPRHGNLLCKEIPLSSKGMTMESSKE